MRFFFHFSSSSFSSLHFHLLIVGWLSLSLCVCWWRKERKKRKKSARESSKSRVSISLFFSLSPFFSFLLVVISLVSRRKAINFSCLALFLSLPKKKEGEKRRIFPFIFVFFFYLSILSDYHTKIFGSFYFTRNVSKNNFNWRK